MMKKRLYQTLLGLFAVFFISNPLSWSEEGHSWYELPIKSDEFYSGDGIEGIPLHIDEPNGMAYSSLPVTGGIPLPQGAIRNISQVRIVDASGKEAASQLSVLTTWPDDSIRWLLVHFQADLAADQGATYFLEYGPKVIKDSFASPLSVNKKANAVEVLTGPLKLTVDKNQGVRVFLDKNGDGRFSAQEAMTSASLDSEIELKDRGEEGILFPGERLPETRWRFALDKDDQGESKGWHKPGVDYNNPEWKVISIGKAWEDQGYKYDGYAWYRRSFKLPDTARGKKIFLCFGAVDERAWVYVNGRYVGGTKDKGTTMWSSPFALDISPALKKGKNLLAIKVHDSAAAGGIWKPIHLEEETAKGRKPFKLKPDKKLGGTPAGHLSGIYRLISGNNWDFAVEEEGPLRATINISGWHYNGDKKYSPTTLRISVYAGKSYLKIDHTFVNTEDPARVFVKNMAVKVPLNLSGKLTFSTELDNEVFSRKLDRKDLGLIQDNATPPAFPRYDEWTPRCRIFSHTDKQPLKTGSLSGGWLDLSGKREGVVLQIRELWKLHPKELLAGSDGTLSAYLWPAREDIGVMDIRRQDQKLDKNFLAYLKSDLGRFWYKDPPEKLKKKKHKHGPTAMGIARTHQLLLFCHGGKVKAGGMKSLTRAFDRPPLISVTPEWNCSTNAMGIIHPYDPNNFPYMERKMDRYMQWIMKHQKEWSNWYGIWDWGGLRYDYDPKSGHWLNDVKHWWNSGEIAIAHGLFMQYFRTCRRDYYELAESVARHGMDVETQHYKPGGKVGRMALGVRHNIDHWGGSRGGCHSFTQGMTDYYFITGDQRAREVVIAYGFSAPVTTLYGRGPDQFSRNILNAWEVNKANMELKNKMEKMLKHQLKGLDLFHDNSGNLRIRNGGKQLDTGFRFSEYRLPYLVYAGVVTGNKEVADMLAQALDYGFSDKFIQYKAGDGFAYVYLNRREPNWAQAAAYSLRYIGIGRGVISPSAEAEKVKPDSFKSVFGLGSSASKVVANMEAVYQARSLNPEKVNTRAYLLRNYTAENKKRISPAAGFVFRPIDISAAADTNPHQDPFRIRQKTKVNPHSKITLREGEVGFDFGSPVSLMPGWLPVTKKHMYPSTREKVITELKMLPFGTTAEFLGIPFELSPVSSKESTGIIVLEDKEEITIPIDHTARRIFFLGHVSGKSTLEDEVGAEYVIRYQDGEEEVIPLRNQVHYQYYGLGALYAREVDYVCELNEKWVNMFNIRPKHKKIKELCFRDTGRGHKVGLFGLTLETDISEVPAPKWDYDFNLGKTLAYTPESEWGWLEQDKQLKVNLPNGAYQANITMSGKASGYTDLWVNDRLVLDSCYILKPGGDFIFPVIVSDGSLKIELIKASRAAFKLEQLRLTRTGDSLATSSAARPEIRYGWRLFKENTEPRGGIPSHLADKKTGMPGHDWVLDDRLGTQSDRPADDRIFAVELENGEYSARLFMGGWSLYPDLFVDVFAEDKLLAEHVRLTPADEAVEIKFRVQVQDGRLDIRVHERPEDFRKQRIWMISALILKQLK